MNPGKRIGALVSKELLEALDKLYPARPPDPKDSDREIWMKAGERRLVDVLRAKLQEAEEEGYGFA
jgi:hypothetical protein